MPEPREIPINLSDLIAAAAWLLFVGCTIGIFMGMMAS